MKRNPMRSIAAVLAAVFLLAAGRAMAFEEVKWEQGDRDLKALTLMEEMFPEATGDIVPWTTIGLAKEKVVEKDGQTLVMPTYDKKVIALDGKEIKVKGFMLPLGPDRDQTRFILSPLPQDCAYCLPAGPNLMIEVVCKEPVRMGFEAVVVQGRLKLMTDSVDGLFYRLEESAQVVD